MDINKEREAFEAWYCRNHTGLKQSDLAKFRTLSGYCFSDPLKINISWEAWQAAKAQAVPEENALLSTLDAVQKLGSGDFVLVPVIDIELAIEALDDAGEGESKYYAGCADGLRKALESLEKNNGN